MKETQDGTTDTRTLRPADNGAAGVRVDGVPDLDKPYAKVIVISEGREVVIHIPRRDCEPHMWLEPGGMAVALRTEDWEELVDQYVARQEKADRPDDRSDPLADADLFAQVLMDRIGRMGWESRQDDPQCYKVLDAASRVRTEIQRLREELRYWKPAQETPPRGGSRADGPLFPRQEPVTLERERPIGGSLPVRLAKGPVIRGEDHADCCDGTGWVRVRALGWSISHMDPEVIPEPDIEVPCPYCNPKLYRLAAKGDTARLWPYKVEPEDGDA